MLVVRRRIMWIVASRFSRTASRGLWSVVNFEPIVSLCRCCKLRRWYRAALRLEYLHRARVLARNREPDSDSIWCIGFGTGEDEKLVPTEYARRGSRFVGCESCNTPGCSAALCRIHRNGVTNPRFGTTPRSGVPLAAFRDTPMQSIQFQTHDLTNRALEYMGIEVVVGHVPGHLRNVWGRRGVECTPRSCSITVQANSGWLSLEIVAGRIGQRLFMTSTWIRVKFVARSRKRFATSYQGLDMWIMGRLYYLVVPSQYEG